MWPKRLIDSTYLFQFTHVELTFAKYEKKLALIRFRFARGL